MKTLPTLLLAFAIVASCRQNDGPNPLAEFCRATRIAHGVDAKRLENTSANPLDQRDRERTVERIERDAIYEGPTSVAMCLGQGAPRQRCDTSDHRCHARAARASERALKGAGY